MRIREYITALWADWLVLMSGSASVVLAFWAAYFPPTNVQAGRTLLWIASVACFAVASYRIWAKERDAREKEIAQLNANHKSEIEKLVNEREAKLSREKAAHKSEIEGKEKQHKSDRDSLIEGHVKIQQALMNLRETEVKGLTKNFMLARDGQLRIEEENRKRNDALMADLRHKLEEQANQIYELTKYKLTFEIDTPRSQVTMISKQDEHYSVMLRLYISFENSDVHPLTVKKANILLIKKNEDKTESAIPLIDEELYETLYDEVNPLSKKELKWAYRELSVPARTLTKFHIIDGHISASGNPQKVLDKNCFLRVCMEAMNQPPYCLDFDVDWGGTQQGWVSITPRT